MDETDMPIWVYTGGVRDGEGVSGLAGDFGPDDIRRLEGLSGATNGARPPAMISEATREFE